MTYIACFSRKGFGILYLRKRGVICREKALIRYYSLREKGISWKKLAGVIRHSIEMLCGQRLYCWQLKASKIRRSETDLIFRVRSSRNGESVSMKNDLTDFEKEKGVGDHAFFPPDISVEIKALACQLPKELGLPFSKLSHKQIAQEAIDRGIVASISGTTVWRWLNADAICPWHYRSWLCPRDPQFAQKAGHVLDLYHGFWAGVPLGPDDYVISSDEKTSIQARRRVAPTTAPRPGLAGRIEHEYERKGALAYMAAWDVRRAKVFGICRPKTGIESFHCLVDHVMKQEPYRSANRVFWITDNGSSHRGETARKRLRQWYPNTRLVHTPIHASWLNQVEIYFSILQRKLLSPNDFEDLQELEEKILAFQEYYEKIAKPFEWKFNRQDLKRVLSKVSFVCKEEKAA